MKILLITDQYPPEIRAISFMMQELAEYFTEKGNVVTVITSMPLNIIEKDGYINVPKKEVKNGV